MGIHDKVKQLSGQQEESAPATGDGIGHAPPSRERKTVEPVSSAETDRLEKLLFKFGAMIEKVEAERHEMKKLSQEVDTQKDTVGKMLVSLDGAIKSLPKTVDACVKAAIEQNSASINHAASRVTDEIHRQVNVFLGTFVKALQDNFAAPVAGLKTATAQATDAAATMVRAKNHVGWQIIAVNVGVSALVVFVLLGVVNRRFPWQLRGPTSQERTYIERGKALTKSWSQLPPKVQVEISRAVNENE